MLHIILFLIAVAIVPVGFSVYDAYRHKAEQAIDTFVQERASKIYHTAKFWTILLSDLVIIYAFIRIIGLTITFHVDIWKLFFWLPLAMTIYWIVFDVYWNKTNGRHWTYPGDGRGGYIEKTLYWISLLSGIQFRKLTIWLKMLFLFITIIITNQYGIFW